MNIALVGYGKMGHAIETAAAARGHAIVARITTANRVDMDSPAFRQADVAIEFTTPAAALDNVLACLEQGVSVVSGTTGWNERISEANYLALKNELAFLHASNFSVGVNIFFEVNQLLAKLMNGHPEYDISLEETHHVHKKDAPSGTAITLAEQIITRNANITKWSLQHTGAAVLPITSHRMDEVPGTHIVRYNSAIDQIEIKHTAHSRDGFARGAVLAAEFICGKKGTFTMKDVLGIH